MALTAQQIKALRPKLASFLVKEYWKNLDYTTLDSSFNELSNEDKDIIIKSLIDGDNKARDLIRERLTAPLIDAANQQADAYIKAGSIPLEVIFRLF